MPSQIRRRITYANVAATLALVFSMSGGALAATHYLISSKKQISPKVLRELKGNAGAKGATGATGATGGTGATGAAGAPGAAGSAVAYAEVGISGADNPVFFVNAGFTSVTEPSPRVFCLTPAYAGHPIVVSPDAIGAFIAMVSPQKCPGGYQLESSEELGSGTGFNVTVP